MRAWLMNRLIINEELEVVGAEVPLAGLPHGCQLVALRPTARLERDGRVSNLGRHRYCRVDHHVAAVVESIVAFWQRVLAFVVHQHSSCIDANAFPLHDEIESLVQVEDAERAKQVVSTSITDEGNRDLQFVWPVEHAIDNLMVRAISTAATEHRVLGDVNILCKVVSVQVLPCSHELERYTFLRQSILNQGDQVGLFTGRWVVNDDDRLHHLAIIEGNFAGAE